MVQHAYLGTHRRGRCQRGGLLLSGSSLALRGHPSWQAERAETIKGAYFVNSFVKTKHVLDGIHEGRFAVLIAI